VVGGLFSILAGLVLTWIFYIKIMSMYSGSNDIIQKQLFSNDYGGPSDDQHNPSNEINFLDHDFPFMPIV
jgi:hypothetical protein